jgi:hypothetical protein
MDFNENVDSILEVVDVVFPVPLRILYKSTKLSKSKLVGT